MNKKIGENEHHAFEEFLKVGLSSTPVTYASLLLNFKTNL